MSLFSLIARLLVEDLHCIVEHGEHVMAQSVVFFFFFWRFYWCGLMILINSKRHLISQCKTGFTDQKI